jgi:hypothetical protein
MNRARVWAPFAIAFVAGLAVTALYEPIGDAMGWYNPFTGYMEVGIFAGVPIGLLAAIASRTWRGVQTFCLGLLALGAFLAVRSSDPSDMLGYGLITLFELGLLGVPTYLVATAVIIEAQRPND